MHKRTESCFSLLRVFHEHCTHCGRVKAEVLPSPLMSTSSLPRTPVPFPFHASCDFSLAGWCERGLQRMQWLYKNSSFGRFWQMLSAGPPVYNLKWFGNLKFEYTNAISRRSTVCLLSHLTSPCICCLRAFAQAHSRFLSLSVHSECMFLILI